MILEKRFALVVKGLRMAHAVAVLREDDQLAKELKRYLVKAQVIGPKAITATEFSKAIFGVKRKNKRVRSGSELK